MNNSDVLQFFRDLFGDEFLSKAFLLSTMMAGLTAVVLSGRKFITFLYSRIRRLIVFSVRIEQIDELFWMLESWLYQNYGKKYRNVISFLHRTENNPHNEVSKEESDQDVKKEAVPPKINFRQNEDFIIIRYCHGWIRVSKGRDKLENASSLSSLFFDSFVLTSLFGTKNIKKLLKEVVYLDYAKRIEKKINYIYLSDGYGYWTRKNEIKGKEIENIFIPYKDRNRIVNDLKEFLGNHKWHEKRDIPYKRGYLFYGSPGNGKTSLALALAKIAKRDIYILNLPSMAGDRELIRSFEKTPQDSILLIEDIDIVLKSKRKINSKSSFSTLLNCLDGAFYRNGLITIMTTNFVETLDDALIRDGRIDLKLFIDYPSSCLMRDYVNNFFEKDVYLDGESVPSMNIAQLQNLCLASSPDNIKEKLEILISKEQITNKS